MPCQPARLLRLLETGIFNMKKNILAVCLVIALLEGFAGLGIEIYAIRISATYIGSSISITGIILAMVLIAIAGGYWYGGKLSQSIRSSRQALLKAGYVLSLAAVAHAIACIVQIPLLSFMVNNTDNSILPAIGVGLLYGVGLLLGSTCIPLITQFLTLEYENEGDHDAGKNAGTMVAITTIGSVLGSTATPILLLPYIGLMSSLALFITALGISAWLCTYLASKAKPVPADRRYRGVTAKMNYALSAFALIVTMSFIAINKIDTGIQTATGAWFIKETQVNEDHVVLMSDNPSSISSCWYPDTKKNCTPYGEKVIQNIYDTGAEDMVFLGGAGMAIPSEIAVKNPGKRMTVIDIDIDKALPGIVEEKFLKAPIASNIEFIGDDARAFFARNDDVSYDFMLIDAFSGFYVASNLYTTEALNIFKDTSEHVVANIIGKTSHDSKYTQTLFANWKAVFGDSAYVVADPANPRLQNIMLCNFDCGEATQIKVADYVDQETLPHTDDLPRLDKYYYTSI